jgi:hypothetical protein
MTQSADLTRLINNARLHAPGATDAAIKYELFQVLNEFFQDSDVWREDVTFGVTPAASNPPTTEQLTYELITDELAAIDKLLWVQTSDKMDVKATMQTPGEVVLLASPSKADTYTATVSLTVTDPTDSNDMPVFPAWILNKYGSGLFEGVVGRLMSQPAKPYTSERLAIYHLRRFQGTKSRAKVDAQHKNLYDGQTWRFPQGFATRSQR